MYAIRSYYELRPVHKKLVIDSRWLPVGGLRQRLLHEQERLIQDLIDLLLGLQASYNFV